MMFHSIPGVASQTSSGSRILGRNLCKSQVFISQVKRTVATLTIAGKITASA
jgi:hypothetical protein